MTLEPAPIDIALRLPELPSGLKPGLWPSAVVVTANPHAPMHFNHQESLEYYRISQHAYAILWVEADDVSAYRLFGNIQGPFAPDFRLTERGEFELVGLSRIPDQPPGPTDGGPGVPAVPAAPLPSTPASPTGPASPAHPSMSG